MDCFFAVHFFLPKSMRNKASHEDQASESHRLTYPESRRLTYPESRRLTYPESRRLTYLVYLSFSIAVQNRTDLARK